MVVAIFPAIDIPVVAVVWALSRAPAEDNMSAAWCLIMRRLFHTVNASSASSRSRSPALGPAEIYFHAEPTVAPPSRRSRRCRSTILKITPQPPGMTAPNVIP